MQKLLSKETDTSIPDFGGICASEKGVSAVLHPRFLDNVFKVPEFIQQNMSSPRRPVLEGSFEGDCFLLTLLLIVWTINEVICM